MKTVKNTISFLLVSISTLLLAACGGGSGSTNNNDINIPTAGISVTSANAKPVSAEVLGSLSIVRGASAGIEVLEGVSISTQPGQFNYSDFIISQLSHVVEMDYLPGTATSGVAVQYSDTCTDGGTVTITGNVSVQNSLTAGDTLTLSYNNCALFNYTINGSMSLTVSQVTANYTGIAPFTLGVDVVLSNLSVNDMGSVFTSNGDMSFLIDVDGAGNDDMQISGNSLTASTSNQAVRLTNYLYDMAFTSTNDFTVSLQGTISSTNLNGSVTYTTPTPFTGNGTVYSGNPTAGELHITTSADSSQAWLIALSDGANVQIDLDTNGDNTVDDTVMTTWTELENL